MARAAFMKMKNLITSKAILSDGMEAWTLKKRDIDKIQAFELWFSVEKDKQRSNRNPGRRRTSWLRNLREWYNNSSKDLSRAAVSKIKIAVMITNQEEESPKSDLSKIEQAIQRVEATMVSGTHGELPNDVIKIIECTVI
ncbi:hypothetical protein ILUMI_02122 [Ignelater luminosus]|uniref:Uncharacterized protein n=1 Tax=Ignelater luminosus TaxID=2038154 RepID=A0A8K0DD56_IGNLU|nr:hypothetical protein ILUMI_02122 [Ignelater luminosus]